MSPGGKRNEDQRALGQNRIEDRNQKVLTQELKQELSRTRRNEARVDTGCGALDPLEKRHQQSTRHPKETAVACVSQAGTGAQARAGPLRQDNFHKEW